MEFLLDFLPIIIYILLIILLSVCIYLLIRAIRITNKVELLLDDIEEKVSSLDNFFKIINFTTDRISIISEKIIEGVVSLIKKLFHKRKDEEDYE